LHQTNCQISSQVEQTKVIGNCVFIYHTRRYYNDFLREALKEFIVYFDNNHLEKDELDIKELLDTLKHN
jgi:hypothetical protein